MANPKLRRIILASLKYFFLVFTQSWKRTKKYDTSAANYGLYGLPLKSGVSCSLDSLHKKTHDFIFIYFIYPRTRVLAPPGARLELLAGAVEGLACPSTRPPAPAWTSTAASVTAGAATTTSTV